MTQAETEFQRGPSRAPVAVPARVRLIAIFVLIALEIGVISLLYQHNFSFVCRDVAPGAFCAFLSLMVLRSISIMAAALIVALARPKIIAPLAAAFKTHRFAYGQMALHAIGFALILAPWFFLQDATDPVTVSIGAAAWCIGVGLAGLGLMQMIAPLSSWAIAARHAGWSVVAVILAATFSPEMTQVFQHVWSIDTISIATFNTVVDLLLIMGMEVATTPSEMIIGGDGFRVAVGRQCSGVEGFLLISMFVALYLWLFRKELRFPHVWLLLPIGLALSWCLNAVRIAALIWIGAHVSPDLAINGFHSHAGWLLFSILSLSLIGVSRLVPWFQAREDHTVAVAVESETLSLRDDPIAAQILPFVVFMASALIASTFSETPAVFYPARAIAMLAVLALFWRYIASLLWRLDALSIATGAGIGVVWVIVQSFSVEADAALETALGAMSAAGFTIWVVSRVLGTTLLVPVIEELFFRGYLLQRLDLGGTRGRFLAIAISSGLFAALHGQWLLAAIAGVLFSLLVLRSGRLADAILAHAVANTVVAGWALYTQNWAII